MDSFDQTKSLAPRTDFSRRGFVITSLTAGFALAVRPVSAETITTDADGLDVGEVKVPVSDGEIPAYRAMPATGGPFATVVVIQEIFGVHEHIKDLSRRLAKAGYFAVAPALYARQGDPSQYKEIPDIIKNVVAKVPDAEVASDIDATVAWAKASGKADTARLGVTGFCWGGRQTWLYSIHNPAVNASVAWYGPLAGSTDELHPKRVLDLVADIKVPVLGLTAPPTRAFRLPTSRRCRPSSSSSTSPARSCSMPTRRTGSTPTTARPTGRSRQRTAGAGCKPGSRRTGWLELGMRT
jgi:carboxymethylenebutenolidase